MICIEDRLSIAINVSTPLQDRINSLRAIAGLTQILSPDDIQGVTEDLVIIDPIIGITQEVESSDFLLLYWSLRILQCILLPGLFF